MRPSTWTRSTVRLSTAVAALISLSACAETGMPVSSSMRLGAAVFAPQGYIRFCERRPDQCGLPSPIGEGDRAELEHVLNRQQWANVLNLAPTSIAAPESLVAAPGQAAPAAPAAPSVVAAVEVAPSPPSTLVLAPLASPALVSPTLVSSAPITVPAALPPPGKQIVHLTPLVWAALNGVNQSVNARIRPMSDEEAFGVSDYWTLPLSDGPRPVGNCKHYALEKRKALVEAGFSADALSLAIVRTGWGEVHAVLVVGTDQGDYVLDNLTPWVKGWQEVRYTWIERQTPGQPLRWAALAKDAHAGVYGAS